jgi:hypothetical protein
LGITQFALGDDEIDYELWNPAHPLGSDYYGVIIENMPILEAIPDETQALKYKLVSLDNRNTTTIPYVTFRSSEGSADTTTLNNLNDNTSATVFNYSFTTEGITSGEAAEGYKVTLYDLRLGDISSTSLRTDVTSNIIVGSSVTGRSVKTLLIDSTGRFKFTRTSSVPAADSPYRSTIVIEGLRTGARVEISVKISD